MGFTTYTFGAFFAGMLAVHVSPLPWRARRFALLGASYLFYASWRLAFLPVLLASTVVVWSIVRVMARQEDEGRRRRWFVLGILATLSPLLVYKYADFFVETVAGGSVFHLIPPLGISFFSFQALSYVIDVGGQTSPPSESLVDYALYIAFFPHIASGPISRPADLLPQIVAGARTRLRDLGTGLALFLFGLWQKKVLADAVMAPIVEKVFSSTQPHSAIDAWTGILAFAHQVLFDFAGYSSCAIGIARCLGIRLPVNFHFPFAARGFSEFWQRWHITLSSWLRDYVYLPLAVALTRRVAHWKLGGLIAGSIAIVASMALIGLWHGASWIIVLWGTAHGLVLAVEHGLKRLAGMRSIFSSRAASLVYVAITVAVFSLLLPLLRFGSLSEVLSLWGDAFGSSGVKWRGLRLLDPSPTGFSVLAVWITCVINLVVSWRLRDKPVQQVIERMPIYLLVPLLTFVVFTLLSMSGPDRAFFYFKF